MWMNSAIQRLVRPSTAFILIYAHPQTLTTGSMRKSNPNSVTPYFDGMMLAYE